MDFLEGFIPLLYVVVGAALKSVWDGYVGKKKSIEIESWKLKADEFEKRLSKFYWPIYLRLQRDNVIWEKILDRGNTADEDRQRLAFEIENNVLIPNHEEIVKIIESNIHLCGLADDKRFENELLSYVRHIDVYRSIRSIGIVNRDPVSFGEPYPPDFFGLLEDRLKRYQKDYEDLLREGGVA